MSLLPSSVQPSMGTPLDGLRPLAYSLWKMDVLSQATSRELAEFYSAPHYVPQGNRIDALNISKMYLELDQVEHSELYVVGPTLSETDRDACLAEIKAHTTAIQREVINREATKQFANQRFAAHTILISAISTNLRRLFQATTCRCELFEQIKTRLEFNLMDNNPTLIASYLRTLKFTDESCAYADVVARSPWEWYSTTLVSFVPHSWHQLPEWRELDRALRSVWQKYAQSIWNRSFMTSSGAAEREVESLMGSLSGIAGSLFRVVQAYGVQLLRFLCYPHSYWPEFIREEVSLRPCTAVRR
ncbi:hypothetical protein DYB38_006499 [Aphanomyces astaci]|uniref:Uncharacterized protein n=1 Tax=Aphanomyces astaci TaxID=112090 RepID=A0A397DRG5_APHAT|nr:hypothetical protein DYB38_006499 [Aphanomyces astaci]